MTATCPHCLNQVEGWKVGVMTVQIAHHRLNDGSLCPGSGRVRSLGA